MVMVDIYFPALDFVYNFKLEEHSRIDALVKEVSEMMCKKYKSAFDRGRESYMLCSVEKGMILEGDATLSEYNIKNGSRLMMV